MTIELHHTRLPHFAQTWPAQVEAIVLGQLARAVAADEVRSIVLSLTADRLRFGVWVSVEWDDFPHAKDLSAAAGFVTLTPWLDQVDAVARGDVTLERPRGWLPRSPLGFDDALRDGSFQASWLDLHRALVATAIEVATQRLATRFPQPVGVFVSLTGSEAPLVAFCDERGAPLYPLRERRREHGYGSVYPQASIDDRQLTVFYPQGEGASEADDLGSVRRWPCSDVEHATVGREFRVRFAGEPFDIELAPGHTREESGGADKAAVTAALQRFITASGRELTGDEPLNLPDDPAAFAAALASQGEATSSWLTRLVKAHSVARVGALLNQVEPGARPLSPLHRELASIALDEGDWQRTLEHLGKVSAKDRTDWEWLGIRAATALGRWADVASATQDQHEKRAAERALALLELGEVEQARRLVEKSTVGDDLAARAIIEARHPTPGADALGLLQRALAEGARPHLLARVALEPSLRDTLAGQRQLMAALEVTRARAEAVPRSAIDASRTRMLEVGPALAMLGAKLRGVSARPHLRMALREERGWVAADSEHRLVRWRSSKSPKVLAEVGERICGLAAVPGGYGVSTGAKLLLLDDAGRERATLRSVLAGDGPLAARGPLLAHVNRSVVSFTRISGDALHRLGSLGMPGNHPISSLGFVGGSRLLVASARGALLLELSDPRAPRVVCRVEEGLELLDTGDGYALAKRGDLVEYLEVTDTVTSRWRLKAEHSPSIGSSSDGRIAVVARGQLVLLDARAKRLEVRALLGADGYPLEAVRLFVARTRVLAMTQAGPLTLEQLPLGLPALEKSVARALPRARAWVQQTLASWVADGVPVSTGSGAPKSADVEPLGAVVGLWPRADSLMLRGQGARSVVSAGYDVVVQLALPGSKPEGDGDEAPTPRRESEAKRRQTQALQHTRRRWATAARGRALRRLLKAAARKLAAKTTVKQLWLGVDGDHPDLRIVEVRPGGGDVPARRAAMQADAPPTLRKQLESSDWHASLEAWALRARRDAAFRAEVLALLATDSLLAAHCIAERVVDVDLEGCTRAWLAAAERDLDFGLRGLIVLDARGNEVAHQKLLSLVDSGAPDLALPARQALGRLDEDHTVTLVKARLASLTQYELERVPVKAIAALGEARVRALHDALLQARATLVRDEPLLVPLVRAGWQPDEATLDRGNSERGQEDELISGLFGSADAPNEAATAVRWWVAREIATNLERPGPLWPAAAPLEKANLGWQRFFDVAWPLWRASGVLERLHAELPARAAGATVKKGQRHADDALFALHLLHQNLLRGEARSTPFALALDAIPYEAHARGEVSRLARLSRVQFGWSLVKAQRYAEARQVADAALADAPDDGQALFFEARLTWLEQGEPTAAMRRIEAALARAADAPGRARLLNLYGAALDAQGRIADALAWFHRALEVSDSPAESGGDPAMTHDILSNLAETHWKLEQSALARQFAEQAARRGSSTDIVKLILAETRRVEAV